MIHQPHLVQAVSHSCTVHPKSNPAPSYLDAFGPEGNILRNHFQSILNLSLPTQIAIFIVYEFFTRSFLAFVLESLPFYSILEEPGRNAMNASAMVSTRGLWLTFIGAIIFSPVVETVINQWFVIWLTMKAIHKPVLAIWISAILFGAFHLEAGLFGFVMSTSAGFYLAIVFIHSRQFSRCRALCTTTALHAGMNGVALMYGILSG